MAETSEVVETPETTAAPAAEAPKPQIGDIVAFCSKASNSKNVKWYSVSNTVFKTPSGKTGELKWLCVADESLEEAGNDLKNVKYAGTAVYKEPEPTVIEVPDVAEVPAAAEAAAEAAPVAQA